MDETHLESPSTVLNLSNIEQYIRSRISGLSHEPMQVTQFSAGYSNLTYLLKIGDWEAVFRRPPFGRIPPKAHDMEREFKILQKINPVFTLAPQPYLYCDDPAITDRHFYIMEKKNGIVLDDQLPIAYQGNEEYARTVSETVVNTLVFLHSIPYEDAGLSGIGKPDGFLKRQVDGWINRYHQSQTDDIGVTKEIEQWLIDNMPHSLAPTIVHNDFKLNNIMISPHDPREAVAVFDWELSTIGDPLTDLGATLAYWTQPGEGETGLTSVTHNPGFITRREFAQLYADKSGRDLSEIVYYLTFAFYKNAVILQQIYSRWLNGEMKDDRFGKLGVGVSNFMHQAYRTKKKELL